MASAQFMRLHERLGEKFFDPVQAASFPSLKLRFRNDRAAAQVGLDGLTDAQWQQHFGAFKPFESPDAQPEPLALRYHGHQFRHYNPDLGDGRGFLFAQLKERSSTRVLDLGTKGSGKTPYSRTADGRLTLKGAVREALATAFLEAFGVNTSRTLSVIETGEELQRHDEPSPARGAVMVRLNHSHIRFGTFQRLAFENDVDSLARLVDHCLVHYYPGRHRSGESDKDSVQLLDTVVAAKAKTVAQWMAAGFVHGVLNTDNMNITAESFDYGPYRFLPHYEPRYTAAYFDHSGLYAYGRQPSAVLWNLQQLGGALSLLASADDLLVPLNRFGELVERELITAVFNRFGLRPPIGPGGELEQANELLLGFFRAMADRDMSFQTPFFELFGGGARAQDALNHGPNAQHYAQHADVWQAIAQLEPLEGLNLDAEIFSKAQAPDLLYDQIESLWQPIASQDDWSAFHAKLAQAEAARIGYGLND